MFYLFKSENGASRSHRIIGIIITRSNKQEICLAAILLFEDDPYLHTHRAYSRGTRKVIINDNREESFSRLRRQSEYQWLCDSYFHRKKKLSNGIEVQGDENG
jgi:hypothetical protein